MRTLNSICLVFDTIYKNPFSGPCHVHSSRVQRIINSKCHMTRKTTTATTQPKMRGKMGHKKRKTCVFYSMSKQWPFFLSILWFSFLLLSTKVEKWFVQLGHTFNYVNIFIGHILWAIHLTYILNSISHNSFNNNGDQDRSGCSDTFSTISIFCFRYLDMSQQNV